MNSFVSSVMAEVKLKVSSVHFFVRQLGWAVLSFCFLMYFKRKDYLDLKSPVWAFVSLGAVLVMLIAVYFADPRTHRWFRISSIGSIQPSEFAKPALILVLAYFMTQRSRSVNDRRRLHPAPPGPDNTRCRPLQRPATRQAR